VDLHQRGHLDRRRWDDRQLRTPPRRCRATRTQ